MRWDPEISTDQLNITIIHILVSNKTLHVNRTKMIVYIHHCQKQAYHLVIGQKMAGHFFTHFRL